MKKSQAYKAGKIQVVQKSKSPQTFKTLTC